MSKPEDIPQDVFETAFAIVSDIQMEDAGSLAGWDGMASVERVARVILAERNACVAVLAGMIRYGGSAEHGVTSNPYADLTVAMRAIRNRGSASPQISQLEELEA